MSDYGKLFNCRRLIKQSLVSMSGLVAFGVVLPTFAIDINDTKNNSDTYEEVTLNLDPETAAKGQAVWDAKCTHCHDNNVPRAPHRFTLEQLVPETILDALTEGAMKEVAADLTDEQKIAVSEFVTRRKLDTVDAMTVGQMCEGDAMAFDRTAPPTLTNWGHDLASTHYLSAEVAQLSAKDLNSLEVEWTFGYPTATRARSQPAIAGGSLFVGSHKGIVYSFDLESGCIKWRFQARSEVRNAIVVESWEAGDEDAAPKIFFGDVTGNQYALLAETGELVWSKRMDEHPGTQLTAASALVDGTLYVPVSSLEEGSAISPHYPCCTFRGSIVALDPATGDEKWRTYFIPPAEPRGKNSTGTPIYGPAGVPIWAGLAFEGDLMLVATGDDYTAPPTKFSDSVIAVNRHTGEVVWTHQTRYGDVWNGSCEESRKLNCPEENGPDWDYGAGPLVAVGKSGKKVVIAGDKGSEVVGIDLETGKNLWRNKVGRGGVVSGINFGIAAHNGRVFIPVSDVPDGRTYDTPARPGIYALDVDTGEYLWQSPSKDDTCGGRPGCYPGYSAAITVTDEYVLAGGNDGWLRAFDVATGDLLWRFDTTQTFKTVDGGTATGGAIGGGQGPLVIGDRLILNSGYAFAGKMPGNLLLVLRAPQLKE